MCLNVCFSLPDSTANLITSGEYKIVTYLRAHDGNRDKSLRSKDYDKYFYIKSGKDALRGWELGLIITGVTVIIFWPC